MAVNFTDQEKLETIEFFIEQWRVARNSETGERDIYLILKSIAKDIRGRESQSISGTRILLEGAINRSLEAKTEHGYQFGNLKQIAELTIGLWPTIRQALDWLEEKQR